MANRIVIADQDDKVAQFVLSMNPIMSLDDTPYTAIGQFDGLGNIVGGCVFTNYTQRDIHGHLAGHGNWLTRAFLGECFRYIFVQLKCRRCTGLVARSNVRAQKFDEGLGFHYEGVLRAYLPNDEDCFIYGMLREECRWLNAGVKKYAERPRTDSTGIARLAAAPAQRRGKTIAALSAR